MNRQDMRDSYLWYCGQHFDFVHSALPDNPAADPLDTDPDTRLELLPVTADGGPAFDVLTMPLAAVCVMPTCANRDAHVAQTLVAYIAKYLGAHTRHMKTLYGMLVSQANNEGKHPEPPEHELHTADTMLRNMLAIYGKGDVESIRFIFRDKPLTLAQQVRFLMAHALCITRNQVSQ